MIAILCNFMDRYELTKECVTSMLENAGIEFQLYINNNGKDEKIIKLIETFNPYFVKHQSENIGNPQGINYLLNEAKDCDYFCIIDNDFILPKDWLKELVRLNQKIENSGVSGFNWGTKFAEPIQVNGQMVSVNPRVFGIKFFNKKVFEAVGYMRPYGKYGRWDADFTERVLQSGFINYYHSEKSIHKGTDVGSNNPYRKMKDECMSNKEMGALFGTNLKLYKEKKNLYQEFKHDIEKEIKEEENNVAR